ncbi:MAG: hypothetical protein K6T86_00965 [Pirellulales bacterium]|nr:hypothetical protein [Pirellulales bacterium]
MFDPYRKWLGIPEESRPPTHYQLLGIAPGEQDPEVIDAAAQRQSAFVRTFQEGEHAEEATRILGEIAEACAVLIDPERRAAYDRQLLNSNLTLAEEEPENGPGARKDSGDHAGSPRPKAALHDGGSMPMGSGVHGFATDAAARGASPASVRTHGGSVGSMGSAVGAGPMATAAGSAAALVPAAAGSASLGSLEPAVVSNVSGAPQGRLIVPARLIAVGPPPIPAMSHAGAGAAVDDKVLLLLPESLRANLIALAVASGLAILLLVSAFAWSSRIQRMAQADGPRGAPSATARTTTSRPAGRASSTKQPLDSFSPGRKLPYDPLDDPRSVGRTGGAGMGGAAGTAESLGPDAAGGPPSVPGAKGPLSGTLGGIIGQPEGIGEDQSGPARGAAGPTETSEFLIDWSSSRLNIPLTRDSVIVYGPTNSPYVLVDGTVHNLTTGEQVFQVGFSRGAMADLNPLAALASDGSMFAYATAPFGEAAALYDCRSGQFFDQVQPPQLASKVMFVAFRQPNELLVGWGPLNSRLQLWNLKTKKKMKEMSCEPFEGTRADLSPDSRHLAVPVQGGVVIYDIMAAKVAARAVVPGSTQAPDGVRFSPDGLELAAVTDKARRLVCWNASAEVQHDFPLGTEAETLMYKGRPLEWAPDGQSWLVLGHHLVDRKTRRTVWTLQPSGHLSAVHGFADQNHLAVVRGSFDQATLAVVPIPWAQIGHALANRPSPGSNLPPVAGPVSIKVETGTLLAGAAEQVAGEISVMVQLRLGQLGIQVQRDAKDELRVTYSETRTTKKSAAPGKQPGAAPGKQPRGAPARAAEAVEVHVARIHLVFRLYRDGKESAAVQELIAEVESAGGAFDERTLRAAATKVLEDLRAPAWADPAHGVLYRLPLISSLQQLGPGPLRPGGKKM